MPIRFHLDEHVPTAIARGLRRHGVEVTTTVDANLTGSGDPDQLGFAASQARVLVTHDQDFTRLHAQSIEHTGICYCHQSKYSVGDLLRRLLLVNESMTEEEMLGHLEYL